MIFKLLRHHWWVLVRADYHHHRVSATNPEPYYASLHVSHRNQYLLVRHTFSTALTFPLE